MPRGVKWLAVVLVLALVFVGLYSGVVRPADIFGGWNTSGDDWSKRGWHFHIEFEGTDIIGSWQSNANTEPFTISSSFHVDWDTAAAYKSYRYALYIEGNDDPVARFPANGDWHGVGGGVITPGQEYPNFPWTGIQIPTDGTIRLKCVLEVKIFDYFQTFTYSDPEDLAWDGAYVRSGRGEIYLPANEQGPFEEGSNVKLYARTGFTGGQGWYIKVYPPPDRTDLDQTGQIIKQLGDDVQTYVSWEVPEGAFKVGSTNEWRAELWNNYFDVGFEQLFTIDMLERAPKIVSVEVGNNGRSMTYTVLCNRTYAPLDCVVVYAWYGYGGTTMPSTDDTESWVMYGTEFPITNNVATFTVTPKNMQGDIVVKMFIYDTEGRASTPEYQSFHVNADGTTIPGPPPLVQPFIWTWVVYLIVAMMIITLLAIWLWWLYTRGNIWLVIIASIIDVITWLLLLYLTWRYGI